MTQSPNRLTLQPEVRLFGVSLPRNPISDSWHTSPLRAFVLVGLPDRWMDASGDLGQRQSHDFAMEIQPILPEYCPTFLQSAQSDTESSKRQDHAANTDLRLRAFAEDTEEPGCVARIEFVGASRLVHRATRLWRRRIASATAPSFPFASPADTSSHFSALPARASVHNPLARSLQV